MAVCALSAPTQWGETNRDSVFNAAQRLAHVAVGNTNLQVAAVDLIDNFQVTGQQMSKQVDWPALQSLGKDCVVGVGAGANTDVPGLDTSEKYRHKSSVNFAVKNSLNAISFLLVVP